MPGEATDAGAFLGLDAKTGRATVTARNTYGMLLTSAPSDTTSLSSAASSELTTAGYSRQQITWSTPALASGVPSTSNSAQLTFGPFTADPPNVTHCGLTSAASGTTGDFIFYWTLDAAKDAAINESIQFAVAALVMQED